MSNIEQAFSSEVWGIIGLIKSDPEHYTLIEMNEGKVIEVLPTDKIGKTLLCLGLFGCYSVVTFLEKMWR